MRPLEMRGVVLEEGAKTFNSSFDFKKKIIREAAACSTGPRWCHGVDYCRLSPVHSRAGGRGWRDWPVFAFLLLFF